MIQKIVQISPKIEVRPESLASLPIILSLFHPPRLVLVTLGFFDKESYLFVKS